MTCAWIDTVAPTRCSEVSSVNEAGSAFRLATHPAKFLFGCDSSSASLRARQSAGLGLGVLRHFDDFVLFVPRAPGAEGGFVFFAFVAFADQLVHAAEGGLQLALGEGGVL